MTLHTSRCIDIDVPVCAALWWGNVGGCAAVVEFEVDGGVVGGEEGV